MQIIISQILLHPLHNVPAGHQGLQFAGDIAARVINKRADDRIVAGILPVTHRFRLSIFLQVAKIIHHIPRTVHIKITEMIPVIPCPDLRFPFRLSRFFQKPVHILLRKTKVFIEAGIRNRIRDKIIGSSKNTFFRHLQAPGQHSKLQ